jgi:hypothetical protein
MYITISRIALQICVEEIACDQIISGRPVLNSNEGRKGEAEKRYHGNLCHLRGRVNATTVGVMDLHLLVTLHCRPCNYYLN